MAKLLIEHPPTYGPERQYIYDVMLGEFLGISYQVRLGANPHTTAVSVCGDSSGKRLIVHDALFAISPTKWLTDDSLPRQPLDKWLLPHVLCDTPKASPEIPVIYGQHIMADSYYTECDGDIQLGLDVFGSAFFMLSRYEEVVKNNKDKHDRFPVEASLAYQEAFLERPIVNEYLEILWACLKRLWPRIERKRRQYSVLLSHDVDEPLAVAGKSWPIVLKSCAGDVLVRRDVGLAMSRVHARWRARYGDFERDPSNTFELLMDVSEQHGLQSSFYFMSVETPSEFDARYSIKAPWMRRLLRVVSARGHEIGYHGSYASSREPAQTDLEVKRLLAVLHEEGVEGSFGGGGRQHYLRWKAASTWEAWDDAGLTYDSSLIFADSVGFRCGVCYEYPTYSLRSRRTLRLRERPLAIMEVTLLLSQYMALSPEEACQHIYRLSTECRRFGGQFTLLWHNSNLGSCRNKRLYKEVVSMITAQ